MITRRTVMKTTAWFVPTVTIAATAPAFATSNQTKPEILKYWKEPGNGKAPKKGYFVAFNPEIDVHIGQVFIGNTEAKRNFPGIFEKRGLKAWGISGAKSSRTPTDISVVMLDGSTYNFQQVKFLPWK